MKASVVALAFLALSSVAAGQPARLAVPVVIQNCGVSTTYQEPPRRAVTLNQSATEAMLALGLHDRMTGTAYLDDAVLPEFAAAYAAIPVLAEKYPSREILLNAQPDFVYAAYGSAFDQQAAGSRDDLARYGTQSYLSPAGCPGSFRPERVTMETVYAELRDIGKIFGVSARAEALIAGYQADIKALQARAAATGTRPRVLWYDSSDPPSVGACCGVPNEIMRLVGATNVFEDTPGSWATVSWEQVVARNPDTIVIVDASWAPAEEKRRLLTTTRAYASIEAVQKQRFVTVDFSATTSGVRIVGAARALAEALYAEGAR